MSITTNTAEAHHSVAQRLGLQAGQIVQQLGHDSDSDAAFIAAISGLCGEALLDDQASEVVDVVLLWWRDGDGDLVDALVDALSPLADGGAVWLLTPKAGREGHVDASDINEAVPTAGLASTKTLPVGKDWSVTRLVTPKSGRR